MKKEFLFIFILFIAACSRDDNGPINAEFNSDQFVTSVKHIDIGSNDPTWEFLFSHENGFLKTAVDALLRGEFFYDANGKLVKRVVSGYEFNYKYDELGRLIECDEITTGNNRYELTYSSGKVLVAWTINGTVYEFDHTTDSLGRVVRTDYLNPDSREIWQVYEYDDFGNIIRFVEENKYESDLRDYSYTYDLNLKNPYHTIYKNVHESVYYISAIGGMVAYDIHDQRGICPNLSKRYTVLSSENEYPMETIFGSQNVIFEYE